MPVYRYCPLNAPCKLCGEGFEHRQAADVPDLTSCPTCGQAVARKGVHAITTPKLLAPPSVSQARNAGFTVLKRTGSGDYEKQ
ncbi:MAG TPA: FmdB family zinc ribbon protein [Opitutaceae bacterium]